MLVSEPACTTSIQRYAVLRSSGCGRVKLVSRRPAMPKSNSPVTMRCTCKSYVKGPGGDDTATGSQVKVGWAESVTAPPGALSEVRTAHGGTTSGPTRGVLAVSPVSARPSTRQKMGAPFSGRVRSNDSAVPSAVSTTTFANELSCAIRSRYVTVEPPPDSVPASQEKVGVIVVSGLRTGARALRCGASPADAAKSGRPQPKTESGEAWLDAKARKVSRIAIGPSVGNSSFMRVMPAARSSAPGPVTTQTATPGAVKSGLSRPSAVGPRLEKKAMLPSESSAPMVSAESASPGVQTVRNPGPSLPAAVTTMIPRRAAASTATVVTAMSPLRSDGA